MSDAHREHYAWMKDIVKHMLLTLGSFIMGPACKEVMTTKTLGSNVSDNMDQTATYHSDKRNEAAQLTDVSSTVTLASQ